MAFLFGGIFQPLRPPSPSEMSSRHLVDGSSQAFKLFSVSPNLDSSRMRLLSARSGSLREVHLSFFLPGQLNILINGLGGNFFTLRSKIFAFPAFFFTGVAPRSAEVQRCRSGHVKMKGPILASHTRELSFKNAPVEFRWPLLWALTNSQPKYPSITPPPSSPHQSPF